MAEQPVTAAEDAVWNDDAARRWLDTAQRTSDVAFAWQLAADLVKEEQPGTLMVLDAASGPGGFLATALDTFPAARGVWFDSSATMLDAARANLDRFGDRVEFRQGDLGDIRALAGVGAFDLVVTSRATHHLPVPQLTRFYQQVAELLVPDGWFANLDSMSDSRVWRQRLRAVRKRYRLAAEAPETSTHEHPTVSPRTSEHLAALQASGFTEIEVVWRVFVTNLVLARKVDPRSFLR